jgi:predicted secreted protein
MARLAGKNGSIEAGGGAIVGGSGFTVNIEIDTPITTGFDSAGHETHVAGVDRWSVSAKGHWDTSEGKFVGATPALRVGVSVTVNAKLSGTANNLYTGTATVQKFTVEVNVDGSVDWTMELKGNGALTYPTA